MREPRHRENGQTSRRLDRPFAVDYVHRIRFTRDVLDPTNPILRDLYAAGPDSPGLTVAFIDDGVAKAWPDLAARLEAYAGVHHDLIRLQSTPRVVPGGEQAKNDRSVVDLVTQAINEAGVCRHSYVIAVGGGAVLDAVGFAAATAHRGVRLIRLPSTTLGQGDAGIGVKNGINAFGKKNFIGTFSMPWGVINDVELLTTLSDRDWRAGLSEAVKVGLLKDPELFERIEAQTSRLRERDEAAAIPIIERSAELHLDHIADGGDPFELLNARPLDHGHWSGHKLEQMSDFRILHGEAVAIGIALDALYAELAGLLPPTDARRVLDCLTEIGFNVYDDALADHAAILEGLQEFREHLGGRLTITLLEGVGRPIDAHEIDDERMIEAIGRLAEYAAQTAARR